MNLNIQLSSINGEPENPHEGQAQSSDPESQPKYNNQISTIVKLGFKNVLNYLLAVAPFGGLIESLASHVEGKRDA